MMLPGNHAEDHRIVAGPVRGDFIAPPEALEPDEPASAPLETEPLGWDARDGFRRRFPAVALPFQVVERVTFGHPELEPNRLFWGDNLHVMRQLPAESVDLIYIDPPFFSGRQYNGIAGERNERCAFSDVWESGLPGYLAWLNARLYEMKRLLKRTGTIYVHCDYHASHYVKVEMDKIFGYRNLRNELIWYYNSGARTKRDFGRRHDVILRYSRGDDYFVDFDCEEAREPYSPGINVPASKAHYYDPRGKVVDDVWRIPIIAQNDRSERNGYPTQKPEKLLARIVATSCPKGGVVADFFCGGGTTPAVAQRLGRRWIACDQSRVAVAIAAARLARRPEGRATPPFAVPDFTVEHWGVYQALRLDEVGPERFRAFVLRAFGAVSAEGDSPIHGYKGAIPVWVGAPSRARAVTAAEVRAFANAIAQARRDGRERLDAGIMLAWAFQPGAREAAERLRRVERTALAFVRLDTIRLDSPPLREADPALAGEEAFLTFALPPQVEVVWDRVAPRTYRFDASATAVINPGATIAGVHWDFDHEQQVSTAPGSSGARAGKKSAALVAQHRFPRAGRWRVACQVRDSLGAEGLWTAEIDVR